MLEHFSSLNRKNTEVNSVALWHRTTQLCGMEHSAQTQCAFEVGWHLDLKIEYNDKDLIYVSSTSIPLLTELL